MDNSQKENKKVPVPTLALDLDVDAWLKQNTGPEKLLSRQKAGSALLRAAIIRFEAEGRKIIPQTMELRPLRIPPPVNP
jgi:hypothetical protein